MNENTKFEDIYQIFLSSIQDYELKRLFVSNIDVAEDMLETFLIRAIPLFYNCVKNISDIDKDNKSFKCSLDLDEVTILADLMTQKWMDFIVNDTTQWGGLQDTDFKRESAANNLKEKKHYLDEWREKTCHNIVMYGLKHTPFEKWAVGDYGL